MSSATAPVYGTAASGSPTLSFTATGNGRAIIVGHCNTSNNTGFVRIKANGTSVAEATNMANDTFGQAYYDFSAGDTISFEAGTGINYTTGVTAMYFYWG